MIIELNNTTFGITQMKTFETLKRYLSQNDWAGAIDYLIGEEKKCPKDLDVSLNLIYCFGIFLTEMDPSQELRDDYTKQSTSLFARAYETFKFNPEFLFYAGWDTKYSFGTATIKYRPTSKGFVYGGFHDEYNFDSKPWGNRSISAELITRSYGTFISGTPYHIYYNKYLFK